MAKIVITKEELEHDQVLESTDKAIHWLKEHRFAVLGTIVGALAIYSAVVLYQGHRLKIMMEGNNLLADAEEIYSAAMADHEWASDERIARMSEVSDLADTIIAQYAGTPVARQALMLKGNAWFNAGDPVAESAEAGAGNTQRAMDTFEQYVAESRPGSFDEAVGNLALAYANENSFFLNRDSQDRIQDALRLYRQVEGNPNAGFLADEAKLARARILDFNGDEEAAAELYREVLASRYAPINALPADIAALPPGAQAAQVARALQSAREAKEQFTLAGTARVNLLRLGREDIREEFPLVAKAQPEPEG